MLKLKLLLSIVRGGEEVLGGLFLKSFSSDEPFQPQVVLTAPEGRLSSLLSVCTLVPVPDEADDR